MKVTVPSACKLNLTLKINKAGDDGFHNLYSVFLKLPQMEKLTINVSDSKNVKDKIVTHNCRIFGKNILTSVLESIHKIDREIPAVNVDIWKTLPPGTGLGGGSGNAAALIRWFYFFSKEHNEFNFNSVKFGSDIPFLLSDTNLALVTGKGEIIEPLKLNMSHIEAVLFIPVWRASTAKSYAQLDKYRAFREIYADPDPLELKEEALNIVDDLSKGKRCGLLPNDFSPLLLNDHPEYGELFELLSNTEALAWGISGSGSSAFALYDKKRIFLSNFREFSGLNWIEQIILQG